MHDFFICLWRKSNDSNDSNAQTMNTRTNEPGIWIKWPKPNRQSTICALATTTMISNMLCYGSYGFTKWSCSTVSRCQSKESKISMSHDTHQSLNCRCSFLPLNELQSSIKTIKQIIVRLRHQRISFCSNNHLWIARNLNVDRALRKMIIVTCCLCLSRLLQQPRDTSRWRRYMHEIWDASNESTHSCEQLYIGQNKRRRFLALYWIRLSVNYTLYANFLSVNFAQNIENKNIWNKLHKWLWLRLILGTFLQISHILRFYRTNQERIKNPRM